MNPPMLDTIRSAMRGELPPPPIAALIGFAPTAVDPGHVGVEMEASERHWNPMGTLHGGVPLEAEINFLRPVWRGTRAEGRVVHAGRSVGLVECDVTDDRERLVARATSTCLTLRGAAAAGR